MQSINGTTIELNRGDILNLDLSLTLEDETPYTFQVGDKVKFSVYGKNRMSDNPVLQKEIMISESTDTVNISCTSDETKIGEYINKPVDYWYEIELNDEHTVLGYDKNGPKIFKLYPEGKENE